MGEVKKPETECEGIGIPPQVRKGEGQGMVKSPGRCGLLF
jgi:hypothetical protein